MLFLFYEEKLQVGGFIDKMKIVRISFEGFEEKVKNSYTLMGDIIDKKLLKEKINEIIEEVVKNGKWNEIWIRFN